MSWESKWVKQDDSGRDKGQTSRKEKKDSRWHNNSCDGLVEPSKVIS